jgi:hypothetical protein
LIAFGIGNKDGRSKETRERPFWKMRGKFVEEMGKR